MKLVDLPLWVLHCHCESCRRATGSLMATFVGYNKDQVIYTGIRKIYESSPNVYRGFCSDCGTPMTYEATWCKDEVHFYINTLNKPEAFKPEKHVFYKERIPWFEVKDHLPRFDSISRNMEPSSWGSKKK